MLRMNIQSLLVSLSSIISDHTVLLVFLGPQQLGPPFHMDKEHCYRYYLYGCLLLSAKPEAAVSLQSRRI